MKLRDSNPSKFNNDLRQWFLDSELNIGVFFDASPKNTQLHNYLVLVCGFTWDEIVYGLRYLREKGWLDYYPPHGSTHHAESLTLTKEGFEEWIFPDGAGPGDPKRIFLSYNTDDKIFAGNLKKYIESHSKLSVFLAHDDIEIGAISRDRMLAELRTCRTFVALRKPGYSTPYTEQECGFAVALGKRVISLCIGGDFDMGFLSDVQGKGLNESITVEELGEYLLKQLITSGEDPVN